MKAIAPYQVKSYGIYLPAACILVSNATINEQESYISPNPGEGEPEIMSNTIVTIKVYASEDAFNEGKLPLETSTKYVNITDTDKNKIDNILLNLAFPESNIEQ